MSRSMSFESPDVEKEFPGLYASERQPPDAAIGEEPERPKKREGGLLSKKKEKKKDKDKGYSMFEAEDSEEEQLILVGEDVKSPSRGLKKHSKPSFKFAKKDKFIITKRDKDEKREKDGKKDEKKRDDAAKDKKRLKKKTKLGLGLPVEGTTTTVVDCKPIFGVPLQVAVERSRCHDGIQLPSIFRECIDYIEEHGLSCEGIYRISGVKSKIQALKDSYNKGRPVYLYEHEPNIVASLLKQYLRELPEPVLTSALMPKFEEASTIKDPRRKVDQFGKLVKELPTPNQLLLSWMIVHMSHIIARAKENKMTLQNVSIVLSPTMQISHRVLNVLFTYCLELFASNCIKKYVPPLKPATSKWSLELPDSPNAIEEELTKQESLLNQLHDEMSRGCHDPEKEEQLWEVQRVVTQLKRKLKFARKKTPDSGKISRQGQGQKLASVGDEDIVLNFDLQQPEDKDVGDGKVKDSGASVKVEEEVKVTEGANDGGEITEEPETVELEAKEESSPVVATETIAKDTETVEKQDADEERAVGEDGEGVGGEVEGETETVEQDDEAVQKEHGGNGDVEISTAEAQDASGPEEIVTAAGDAGPGTEAEEGEAPVTEVDEGETRKAEIPDERDVESDNDVDEEVAAVTAEAEEQKEKEAISPAPVQQKRVKIIEPPREETPEEVEEPRADTATPPQTLPVHKHRPGFGLQSPLKPEILHKTAPRKLKHQGRIDEENGSGGASMDSPDGQEEQEAEESDDHDPISDEPDEEMQQIQLEYQTLLLEEEEYIAVGDELKKKITAERDEIERLQMEIEEVRCIRGDSFDADDWSDSDSSYESGDEDELQEILQQLMKDNTKLEVQNKELCHSIHQERKICLDVKVQIRIIQQQAEQYAAGSDSLL